MANFIKFFKQSAAPENVAGNIWFDKSTNLIKVGNGTSWEEFGGVVDAKFENSVLTIRKANAEAFTLDFSDVASTEGVNRILSGVADRLDDIDSSISTIKQNITDLDASYKAADTALETKLVGDASADYNTLGKLQGKIEAEASTRATEDASVLKAAKDYADTKGAAATTKVAEGTDAGDNMTIESSIDASGATTYTINLTNVASASAFAAHDGSADIHVTKAQKEAWQKATNDINAFLADNDASNTALDTLKEIQDFLSADNGAVKALTAQVDANKTAIATLNGDASTAGSVAKAVADVVGDAAEGYNTLGKLEDMIQAEAATRKNADDDLSERIDAITNGTNAVISFGGQKGEITVRGEQTGNGAVNLSMNGKQLEASIVGLKSAAFTDSSAYATADQGALADSAVQEVVEGETNGTIKVDGTAVAVHGLKSAAFVETTAFDASGAAATVKSEVIGAANDDSSANTIYGAKKYAAEVATAAQNAATVTGVNGNAVADASNYVSITLGLDNKNVKVASVSVDTQAVATAGDDAKGLAEASDVKSYVDNQIATNALSWVVLE